MQGEVLVVTLAVLVVTHFSPNLFCPKPNCLVASASQLPLLSRKTMEITGLLVSQLRAHHIEELRKEREKWEKEREHLEDELFQAMCGGVICDMWDETKSHCSKKLLKGFTCFIDHCKIRFSCERKDSLSNFAQVVHNMRTCMDKQRNVRLSGTFYRDSGAFYAVDGEDSDMDGEIDGEDFIRGVRRIVAEIEYKVLPALFELWFSPVSEHKEQKQNIEMIIRAFLQFDVKHECLLMRAREDVSLLKMMKESGYRHWHTNEKALDGWRSLHWFAEKGDVEGVKFMLACSGINVNELSAFGKDSARRRPRASALYLVARAGESRKWPDNYRDCALALLGAPGIDADMVIFNEDNGKRAIDLCREDSWDFLNRPRKKLRNSY